MMIPVTFKKKTYRIAFDHLERDYVVPKTKKATAISEKRRVTTCSIWLQPKRGDVKLVATGQAVCRPPDKFSRPEGRKRALTRAVVALTGPRKRWVTRFPDGKAQDFVSNCDPTIRRHLVESGMVEYLPINGARELRKAVWDAYFARLPMRVTVISKLLPGKMFVKMLRPPTDAELKTMMDAASASLHEGMD
jgi:hypothetical protein